MELLYLWRDDPELTMETAFDYRGASPTPPQREPEPSAFTLDEVEL